MTTVPLFDHFTANTPATATTVAFRAPGAGATPHGFDAFLVRAGSALTAWGERSAARRSVQPQLLRLQAQSEYAESRSTLMALGNSLLLR